MRSWERAPTSWSASSACAVLAALLGCGSGDMSGSGGGRFNNPPSHVDDDADGAGNGGAGTSSGSAGADFGNTDGTPPPETGDPLRDAGNGVNTSDNPDDQKCGGDRFKPEINMEVIPGNILFVFDKSGSMKDSWTGAAGNSKWADAIAAIPAALTPLKDQVSAGSLFFPTDGMCAVLPVGMAPQIDFMAGPDFLSAWDSFQMTNVADGATPLRNALMEADAMLQAALPNLVGITSVVIVTDGQPNCLNGDQRADDMSANLTPFLTNWLGLDVKTYVVGLPGLDGSGLSILNDLAVAGGTMQYIPADDPMTLQTELAKIVSESVTTNFDSCTLPLDMAPPDTDLVNLVVVNQGMENSVERDLGTDGGWTIDAAGENIILQGRFCDLAKMGEYDEITVVYGCTEAPPLPPLPPPI